MSKFVSLVKTLTTDKRGDSNSSRRAGRSFTKRLAYLLLRCVDPDGDRTVELGDFVAYVFSVWTWELYGLQRHESLRWAGSDNGLELTRNKLDRLRASEDYKVDLDWTRKKRRQLQKARYIVLTCVPHL